jgi:hypothetical protein
MSYSSDNKWALWFTVGQLFSKKNSRKKKKEKGHDGRVGPLAG